MATSRNLVRKQHTLQGVNFGGWLIVEKWLTPTLFDGNDAADEWGLSRTEQGRDLIEGHRNQFITESDFEWCRQYGIELIRLPIGYWIFDDVDGYVAQQKWVDWAFKMAKKYDLLILLDLHGVQGSQNGNEHSGRAGVIEWYTYTDQTLQLLDRLASKYGRHSVLWGIEILNEPDSSIDSDDLTAFYQAAYQRVAPNLNHGTYVVFHDSFRPFTFNGAIQGTENHPVAMDVHWYLFSSRYAKYVPTVLLLLLVGMSYRIKLFLLRRRQVVIVGEWSSVLPQVLFDRTAKTRHQELLRKAVSMQEKAYVKTAASIYWNYKAEGGGMWNYRALREDGVMKSETTE